MINNENVRLVRLISGEEIIGEIIKEQQFFLDSSNSNTEVEVADKTTGGITIKNPYIIVPQQQGNQIRIGMAPWIIYNKDKMSNVYIRENAIVFVIVAPETLTNQYAKMFSSIDVVSAMPAEILRS